MSNPRNLLLDTHVFLWWQADDPRLRAAIRTTIANAPQVYISAASAWEVAIKIALGKLLIPEPFAAGVLHSGFAPLPITLDHAARVTGLPALHSDPFDRMLVAQACAEDLTLVTADAQLRVYMVPVLWAG